jgi:outer membrane immunogenic protein
MLRKLLCILAVSSLLIALPLTAVFAADMPLKAPPPPVASWTGWYVGLDGGYGWDRSTGSTTCITPEGVVGGLGCWTPNSGMVRPEGGLFGGQIGYNLQSNSIVYGLESDIQWSGIKSTGATSNICCTPAFVSAVGAITASADLQWFGTVRARAGVLVAPNALLYATGGLIYGRESLTSVLTYPLVSYPSAGSVTRAGGTAGGGIEYAFTRSFSGRIEGLWYEMGSANIAVTSPLTLYTYQTHYNFEGSIVRGGLNWKLGMQ